MYMANAKVLHLVPNATYIPLTRVGGFALGDAKDLRHLKQKIPTCWYPQRKILASGTLPNAKPRRQVFCVTVEYRLKLNISQPEILLPLANNHERSQLQTVTNNDLKDG